MESAAGGGQCRLAAVGSATLRGLLDKANGLGLARGDTAGIFREDGTWILVYWKDTDRDGGAHD